MSINESEDVIATVNSYLKDFKVNHSMTNDARVINIETKIESAQSSLNSANSLFSDENYAQAYTLAETSKSKAEEALTSAEAISEDLSKGFLPDLSGSFTIIIIIVIILIIGIVGYLVYTRATSWDELG